MTPTVTVADRFYPSSKNCHLCGEKNETLTLKDRQWICRCGALHDRDINAAKNLEKLATASSAGIQACREESADGGRKPAVKLRLVEAGIQH